MIEFPKWKYHATEAACVVDDAEAEKALGKGWGDTPHTAALPEPSAYSEEDRQAMLAEAKALGLKPKSNAKAETLALAIAAHKAGVAETTEAPESTEDELV